MCILCSTYGTKPIEDDFELEEILKVCARVLRQVVDPGDEEHVMALIDKLIGEDANDFEEDSEFVGDWERVIKDGRLTRDE